MTKLPHTQKKLTFGLKMIVLKFYLQLTISPNLTFGSQSCNYDLAPSKKKCTPPFHRKHVTYYIKFILLYEFRIVIFFPNINIIPMLLKL